MPKSDTQRPMRKTGERENNDGREQGEDRTLQKGERALGGSSGLTDSREAPSYANYLALVSSYLLVYVDAASASCDLYESKRVRVRAKCTRCACLCATDKPSRIPRCQSTILMCLPRRTLRFFLFCTRITNRKEESITFFFATIAF